MATTFAERRLITVQEGGLYTLAEGSLPSRRHRAEYILHKAPSSQNTFAEAPPFSEERVPSQTLVEGAMPSQKGAEAPASSASTSRPAGLQAGTLIYRSVKISQGLVLQGRVSSNL